MDKYRELVRFEIWSLSFGRVETFRELSRESRIMTIFLFEFRYIEGDRSAMYLKIDE